MSGLVPVVASGIIYPVSTRATRLRPRQVARLHRREDARARRATRLRKAAWARYTRPERRRAAAERWRQLQCGADQRREKLLGRVIPPLAIGVVVPALTFMALTGAVSPHHSYPLVSRSSLGGLALPAPDVPHLPEPDGTYYTPIIAAGTASTFILAGPVPSEIWDGSERYGLHGPNIFGD